MTIAREEIFGPVLSVIRVKTLDDAIALVNSSPLRQRHFYFHRQR
jgi:malonate-semialdehyde dehydrogenase (acetylating)/methylmalonate-semialdehyde dehydrogenase